MAKTEETIQLERDIRRATYKVGTFGCSEVTIGFGGKERVDYMTYDTSGIFRCYEIKVTKSDFHSKHKHSFVGHYNYFVLTRELWEQVADEIPDWVGCYVGTECVKKPKKQDIDSQEYKTRRTVNGKSTQIVMPYTEMLKDSFIRSLARDSQKLFKHGDKNFVDKTNRYISECERTVKNYRDRHDTLYSNVKAILGKSALDLLYGKPLDIDEIAKLRQKALEELKMKVEYRPVKEHIEVYIGGEFAFSADTVEEAHHELDRMEVE